MCRQKVVLGPDAADVLRRGSWQTSLQGVVAVLLRFFSAVIAFAQPMLCYYGLVQNPVIRVGISSCLLGRKVRYDGGHQLDTLITEILGKYFEWVPVCPEMEIGLGAPRETLRLVGDAKRPRLVGTESGRDHTGTMTEWAGKRLEELAQLDLDGCILKKGSPSCGMERVPVYREGKTARSTGTGIYAGLLLGRFSLLPVEEEGRLRDVSNRENFVERVFAHHRWQGFVKAKPRPGDLVRFHARHKLTLLSHSGKHYRELGRLVAGAGKRKMNRVLDEYGCLFMEALRIRATPGKHANVLLHILGFLKDKIEADDRAEVTAAIDGYRKQLVSLAVPIILLRHHLRRHPIPWLFEQVYFTPCPAEPMLRNQVDLSRLQLVIPKFVRHIQTPSDQLRFGSGPRRRLGRSCLI